MDSVHGLPKVECLDRKILFSHALHVLDVKQGWYSSLDGYSGDAHLYRPKSQRKYHLHLSLWDFYIQKDIIWVV